MPRARQWFSLRTQKKEQQHHEHVNSAFAMDLAYEDDVVDLTGATESPPRPLAPVSAKREAGTASGAPAKNCLLYTSPSPRDATLSRMPSSA